MVCLIVYDSDGDIITYPRLINLIVQQDNVLCFTYIDALGCIITETYTLVGEDYFKIIRYF